MQTEGSNEPFVIYGEIGMMNIKKELLERKYEDLKELLFQKLNTHREMLEDNTTREEDFVRDMVDASEDEKMFYYIFLGYCRYKMIEDALKEEGKYEKRMV